MILWRGHCSVHGRFSVEAVDLARREIPGVKVIVHPECRHEVVEAADEPTAFRYLYELDAPLVEKIEVIAREVYGADGVDLPAPVARQLARFEELGYGGFPVVIAKTHLSISSDPTLKGAPTGWRLPVREVRVAAGAGYVYAIAGDMRTMPGLSRTPAAMSIDLDDDGEVVGLF